VSDIIDASSATAGQATRVLVQPLALTPEDIVAYDALRNDAVWFESAGAWSSFRGAKAADALNGLVTNDVSALRPGEGQHAAALTPKGKIIADMLIVRVDEETFLMTVLRSAADQWLALAKKYVNPRLAAVTDESDRYSTWMLYGARAAHAVAMLGGAGATAENLGDVMMSALAEWPVWQHGPWNLGPASVRLIRAPLMGAMPGFILLADAADAPVVRHRLEASTRRKATRNVWNIARIEGGRPAWGIDMDENTLPQEANLDALGAISFSKGCYTGQETVARIHFRGHVNKNLRGLLGAAPMPQGASVFDEAGKVVGEVRSTVISPRLGPIAFAMIRREVESGQRVVVEGGGATIVAQVSDLPFPDAP
jgi:folate-binding protein YgfZ